tara:strand:+ start:2354 stop:3202 length:849 start_codon:yes stop_codon:yes gene_type:complete
MRNYIEEIAEANFHGKKGLYTEKIFKFDTVFFNKLQQECVDLANSQTSSQVENGHITNWTSPFGDAVQYSLKNTSGNFNDTSTDHILDLNNKKFHYPEQYPTLNELITLFPTATNFRLNGMGVKSGLSPHEEHIVYKRGFLKSFIRARFHIPIQTNKDVAMLIGDHIYRYEEGNMYFFNNGAIHSADNQGDTYRFHLVFDILLDKKANDLLFYSSNLPKFLKRTNESLKPLKKVDVSTFQTYGRTERLYKLLFPINKIFSMSQFARIYNKISLLVPRKYEHY